jgi:predicted lipoprotein with Yx(FWY)xxD motif
LKNKRLKSAGLAGVAAVGFATAVFVGVAAAMSFTLNVASGAKVTNQQGMTTKEAIVVGAKRRAVYTLSGDSKSHPECKQSNQCFQFWPPVTVAPGKHATKASGIKGKLKLWHRNGFSQVLLGGHPLYYFAGDTAGAHATGEGIVSFGGTWHAVKADPSGGGGSTSTGTTPTYPATTTTPTTTTPCVPYPGYPCP